MPPKNRRGKRPAKRGNRSAGGGNGRGGKGTISAVRARTTEIIEQMMPMFPPKITKRLRYSTNIALSSTAGAVTTWVFAANGLYDPDVTSTGHQPMPFDSIMDYFNHYTVIECQCRIIAKAVSSSKMTICLRQNASPTPITVIDRIVETGGAVIEYLELASTSGATKALQAKVNIPRLQGVSRSAITADASLRGSVAANPTELSYFHVAAWDAAAQTGTVNCDVILDFVAVFTEPRDLTISLEDHHMKRDYDRRVYYQQKQLRLDYERFAGAKARLEANDSMDRVSGALGGLGLCEIKIPKAGVW